MAGTTESLDLGPVSAYAIAVANGYTGTEEQWAAELAAASTNAQAAAQAKLTAEGYATGKQNGVAVSSGEYFQNNADYYNQQAQSAKTAAETAAAHYPVITNDYWYVWDATSNQYVNTNIKAEAVDGVTFTPSVSAAGVLSWTNNGNLPNPEPVNIKGDPGENTQIHICTASEYDAVSRVPTIMSPDETKFYLVPAADGAGSDMYTEWFYANNAWEIFGTTRIDLSDYATKAQNVTTGNFAALDANGNLTDSGHKHSDYLTNHQDISGKVDKVSNATAGNFTTLDANGNITDSGYKPSDYLTSHQDVSGKTDKVSNATAGNFAGLDANGNLIDSGHKHSDYLTEHQTIPVTDVQINGTSVLNNGVASIPIADSYGQNYGVVKVDFGNGIGVASNNILYLVKATDEHVKGGMNQLRPIVPLNQHASVFYGLAKAAGDTTQSQSDNAVGTYTTGAKTAIQQMLGVPSTSDIPAVPVQDVQVNGGSILNNGIANIPIATSTNYGIVKIGAGLATNEENQIYINGALVNQIQTAAEYNAPIVPARQHYSVFYGLAKAAGADMASSNNPVGTYTTEAKSAIRNMFGIETSVELSETVSDTDPVLTCQPNVRYTCGEVSTISITPPANGSAEVIFSSGSTPAVLTLPNSVKLPSWFDASSLETNTIYYFLITDGVYGTVMTWDA